jgi:hypothetical protein
MSVSFQKYAVFIFIGSIAKSTLFVKLVGIGLEATMTYIFLLLNYEYLILMLLFRPRNWRSEPENIRTTNCFVFVAAENVMN